MGPLGVVRQPLRFRVRHPSRSGGGPPVGGVDPAGAPAPGNARRVFWPFRTESGNSSCTTPSPATTTRSSRPADRWAWSSGSCPQSREPRPPEPGGSFRERRRPGSGTNTGITPKVGSTSHLRPPSTPAPASPTRRWKRGDWEAKGAVRFDARRVQPRKGGAIRKKSAAYSGGTSPDCQGACPLTFAPWKR